MATVIGCGIDIEEIGRFDRLIPSGSEVPGFSRTVFTDAEIENNRRVRPHLTFPLAFSCKEAFFKAFGMSWSNSPMTWKDIEIIFQDENDLEEYSINLYGWALELSNKNTCRFETSFEVKEDHVVFHVLLFSK